MNRSLTWLRHRLPPPVRRTLRRLIHGAIYHGDFASWEDARRASRGYGDAAIRAKVIAAARAVRDGHAAWDRDTVLFAKPAPNPPLLRALRAAATANRSRLRLVDIGGALGSTWWQHRPWLSDFVEMRWSVVEQVELVTAGRAEFMIGPLRFFESLASCLATENPDVALLSSVLPYLERPHAILAELRASQVRHLIVDRTGFTRCGRDRLTVQRVPPSIYEASYPCWFFDRAAMLAPFFPDWRLVDEWVTEDVVDIDAEPRGFMLERIS